MVEVIRRIDLCYSNASVILTPVQNDAGSRFLVASLTSEGEPYTIPEGCTVQLAVRKPDGTKTLTAASVKDNTVVCELTNQSLAVKGIADAQIIIYNGLAVLKTPPFKLNTLEQIVSDDTIVSTDEFTALSEIMKNYQEISAEVKNIGKYRLVNDITLSEDVSGLKVTNDDNGAPLKLKDMFMLFIGETTLTGSHTIFFNSEYGVKYYMYKTYNFPAGICGLFCDVRKLYDVSPIDKYLYLTLMPDRVLSQVSPNAIQGLSSTHAGATVDITFRDIDGKQNLANITTLWLGMPTAEINKGFKFKAGSRIRIYGIDAE